MERNVEKDQLDHLESRYMHLDNRVGNISQDVSSVKATLVGVVEALNRLASDLKPQPVSITAWLGVSFVILSLMGGVLLGASSYIDLQLVPLRQELASHAAETTIDRERVIEYAREHGYIQARIEDLEADIEDVDKLGSRKWIQDSSANGALGRVRNNSKHPGP